MGFGNNQVITLTLQSDEIKSADRGCRLDSEPGIRQTSFHSRGDLQVRENLVVIPFDVGRLYSTALQLPIEQAPRSRAAFSVNDGYPSTCQILNAAYLLGISLLDNQSLFPMSEGNDEAIHPLEITIQIRKVPGSRTLVDQVNSSDVHFASLQCADRDAGRQKTRHYIVFGSLFEVFRRKKHCRITSRDNEVAAESLTILKELNLHMLGVGPRSEDQSVCGGRKTGKLSEADQGTNEYSHTYLTYLGADLVEAFRQRPYKLAFDDLAIALEIEEILDSTAQYLSELQSHRSRWRVLIGLHGANRLARDPGQIGKLLL